MTQPGTLFCFGLGYSAGFLARALSVLGWRVYGTAREPPAGEGEFPLHRFDRDHPLADAARLLGDATHILVSIPPDAAGCPVRDLHGET
ncbi:MAG: SDR family NAD(P)-dependent oxidoreductase, partial [Stellaceae bacterium]